MNVSSPRHTVYLVPVSQEVGLTSMALGLVRALRLAGVRVGYFKPIFQPEAVKGDRDLAVHFARSLCGKITPDAIAFDHAAEMVRAGQLGGLMEEVVTIIESVRATRDVVIVEGLIPEVDIQVATRLNIEMIKSLGADVIPVLSARDRSLGDLAIRTATAIEQYGDEGRRTIAGVLLNHCAPATATALTKAGSIEVEGKTEPVPVLAAVSICVTPGFCVLVVSVLPWPLYTAVHVFWLPLLPIRVSGTSRRFVPPLVLMA